MFLSATLGRFCGLSTGSSLFSVEKAFSIHVVWLRQVHIFFFKPHKYWLWGLKKENVYDRNG